MRRFSGIQSHPVLFFWLSLAYMGGCSAACEMLSAPDWVQALVILPVNFLTWPVACALLGNGNWKTLHFIDRQFAFLLPILSAALVIVLLL